LGQLGDELQSLEKVDVLSGVYTAHRMCLM